MDVCKFFRVNQRNYQTDFCEFSKINFIYPILNCCLLKIFHVINHILCFCFYVSDAYLFIFKTILFI